MTDLRVLNLGAGVQSSTVSLMMAKGEIQPADIAIFADTQWEPREVYMWLQDLEEALPFPVRRVTAGNIRADALNESDARSRFASMPLFIDTGSDTGGRGRRQCTREYKIDPIQKAIRQELGVKTLRGKTIEQVFGISWDEVRRMKDPTAKWERFDYPLIDRRMTRTDCLKRMNNHGYKEPPRSACIGCPFRSNTEWRHLKMTDPDAFLDAVAFDEAIRQPGAFRNTHKGTPYLHRSMVPLDEVDFRNQEDRGQLSWTDECEGMCGI